MMMMCGVPSASLATSSFSFGRPVSNTWSSILRKTSICSSGMLPMVFSTLSRGNRAKSQNASLTMTARWSRSMRNTGVGTPFRIVCRVSMVGRIGDLDSMRGSARTMDGPGRRPDTG